MTSEGQIYGQNSKFWQFLGIFPHFCPDKREIWHGEAGQISRLSGQRVAHAVRKPISGLLGKNNTGNAGKTNNNSK